MAMEGKGEPLLADTMADYKISLSNLRPTSAVRRQQQQASSRAAAQRHGGGGAGAAGITAQMQGALARLDRGLRAAGGDQYECVARMPDLLRMYPYPMFATACFLKLAEAFRDGTNQLRACVVAAASRCAAYSHLVDGAAPLAEAARRLLTVAHSNDTRARRLALEALGALAPALHGQRLAQQFVRTSLDSEDEDEVVAAVATLTAFVKWDRHFATSLCPRLVSMLSQSRHAPSVRLKLIASVGHMGGAASAHTVDTLAALLCDIVARRADGDATDADGDVRTVTMHALIGLAVDAPGLLLKVLDTLFSTPFDGQTSLAIARAAGGAPHCFKTQHIELMFTWAALEDGRRRRAAYTCLAKLLHKPTAVLWAGVVRQQLSNETLLRWVTVDCVCASGVSVSPLQFVCALMACLGDDPLLRPYTDAFVCGVHSRLALLTCDYSDDNAALSPLLRVVRRSCHVQALAAVAQCLELTIHSGKWHHVRNLSTCLLGAVDTISADGSKCDALSSYLADWTHWRLTAVCAQLDDEGIGHLPLEVVHLLLLPHNKTVAGAAADIVSRGASVDRWRAYCIGRAAMRYGRHALAAHVFRHMLADQQLLCTAPIWMVGWLRTLSHVAEAEAALAQSGSVDERVRTALQCYNRAVGHITHLVVTHGGGLSYYDLCNGGAFDEAAARLPDLQFALQWFTLRGELLRLADDVLRLQEITTSGCDTAAPPVDPILAEIGVTARPTALILLDELAERAAGLHDKVEALGQGAPHADENTLALLASYAELYDVFAGALSRWPHVQQSDMAAAPVASKATASSSSCVLPFIRRAVASTVDSVRTAPGDDDVDKLYSTSIRPVLEPLLSAPFFVPRLVFQRLGRYVVKLKLSPEPSSSANGDCRVPVALGAALNVNVEGGLEGGAYHSSMPGRRFDSITVHCDSLCVGEPVLPPGVRAPQPQQQHAAPPPAAQHQCRTVRLAGGEAERYFTAAFQCTFDRRTSGGGRVLVACDLLSDDGRLWRAEQTASLFVKLV